MTRRRNLLLVLALVTVASVELFAASPNGVTVSQGGRIMTVPHVTGSKVTPSNTADTGLVKIYNTIGTAYPKGRYWCCEGGTVSGSATGAEWWDAAAFTPSADHTVTKIELALGYLFGTNEVVISLNNDANGVPGTVIQSWTAKNLPGAGLCCALVVETSQSGIPVTAGTQYWITVTTSASATDVTAVWDVSDTDQIDSAPGAARCQGSLCPPGSGAWKPVDQQPAFAVAVLGQ